MSRVKRGIATQKRHKRLLKQAKGFWGLRKNVFRRAKETLLRSMMFAFKGRKLRKRDFRSLWIKRISAACKRNETSYSVFMHTLSSQNIQLNRKIISQLAVFEPEAFTELVKLTKTKTS